MELAFRDDEAGAHDRDRTGDLVLTKDVLYRLSYVGTLQIPVELNPLASATQWSG